MKLKSERRKTSVYVQHQLTQKEKNNDKLTKAHLFWRFERCITTIKKGSSDLKPHLFRAWAFSFSFNRHALAGIDFSSLTPSLCWWKSQFTTQKKLLFFFLRYSLKYKYKVKKIWTFHWIHSNKIFHQVENLVPSGLWSWWLRVSPLVELVRLRLWGREHGNGDFDLVLGQGLRWLPKCSTGSSSLGSSFTSLSSMPICFSKWLRLELG